MIVSAIILLSGAVIFLAATCIMLAKAHYDLKKKLDRVQRYGRKQAHAIREAQRSFEDVSQ